MEGRGQARSTDGERGKKGKGFGFAVRRQKTVKTSRGSPRATIVVTRTGSCATKLETKIGREMVVR